MSVLSRPLCRARSDRCEAFKLLLLNILKFEIRLGCVGHVSHQSIKALAPERVKPAPTSEQPQYLCRGAPLLDARHGFASSRRSDKVFLRPLRVGFSSFYSVSARTLLSYSPGQSLCGDNWTRNLSRLLASHVEATPKNSSSQHFHYVFTITSTASRMGCVSSSVDASGASTTGLPTAGRSSSCEVCPEEEGMAAVTAQSL